MPIEMIFTLESLNEIRLCTFVRSDVFVKTLHMPNQFIVLWKGRHANFTCMPLFFQVFFTVRYVERLLFTWLGKFRWWMINFITCSTWKKRNLLTRLFSKIFGNFFIFLQIIFTCIYFKILKFFELLFYLCIVINFINFWIV